MLFRLISRFLSATSWIFPKRRRLPLRYWALVHSPGAEPELEGLFSLCKRFGCAVDVGANHGFYTWKMAQHFKQVYAFEANRTEDFDLLHYRKRHIHFFRYGLSNTNEIRMLHIPVRQGVAIAGWASVENRELPFADSFVEMPVELQRLDDQSFVQNQTLGLIKIDVEGHELEVLEGGLETIRRDKPVLIIEDNAEQRTAIRELLASLGYRSTTFEKLIGKPAPSPNLIWFPRDESLG